MDGIYFVVFNICFNIHIRISEERLDLADRVSSIFFIVDATDVLRSFAICLRISMNSRSMETLVWWPDKDTEILFILYFPNN